MTTDRADRPLEAPLSGLERALVDEFLRTRGYDPAKLAELPAAERDALLKDASVHASAKLSEVESRAHFVHDVHDATAKK